MISMDEARARADRRLMPLASRGGQAIVDDVGLSCPGTDLRGPDLEDELARCRAECVSYLLKGNGLGGVLNGLLFRTFWLGYECGKAAE